MIESPDERSARQAARAILAAFAFVSVFCVDLFPRRPGGEFAQSPNELSRYQLVVSIVDRGSLSIGPELARFGDHEDKSVYRGRFYSNKAPGLSLAAAPVYAAIRLFTGPARPGNAALVFFLIRLLTVTAAVLAALVFFARRAIAEASAKRHAAALVFAVAFGTPLLVYGRSFFSHAWTAALLYLAFECLHRPVEGGWHPAVAGFLAGWAVLSEYPAAIVAAGLLADAAWKRPARRAALFLAGALPAAVVLGLYDAACFSGPFDLSSSHEWFRGFSQLSAHRLFGFAAPSPRVALAFLFSPARGVLVQSPFLLFVFPALFRLRGRALRVSIAAAGLLFLAMCGYENWHGGWALGARYLLPAVFLACWPIAAGVPSGRAGRILFGAAAAASALFSLWSGSTFWFNPAQPTNAPRFFTGFWLARGWFVRTLAGDSLAGVVVLALATFAAGAIAFAALFSTRLDAGSDTRLEAVSRTRLDGASFARLDGSSGTRLDGAIALLAGAAGFALFFAGPPPRARFDDRLIRVRLLESFTELDPGRAELLRLAPEAETDTDRAAWARAVRRAVPR